MASSIATMEDVTLKDAAQIVSSSSMVTSTGIQDLSQADSNELGTYLLGATAIGDMSKWVRGDTCAEIQRRHGLDGLLNASRQTGLAVKTLQNAATAANSWPYELRMFGRFQSYSHHCALNAMCNVLKEEYLLRSAENGWTVSQLRMEIAGRVDEVDNNVIEDKWQVQQQSIDRWLSASGVQSLEHTRSSVTLTSEAGPITIRSVILPSGLAGIEIEIGEQ